MSLLIKTINNLLVLYPKLGDLYHYDFTVTNESGDYKVYPYSSVNKYPELNKAIQDLMLEKYKHLIEQEATFFIEITNKNSIKVDINYIKSVTEEFKL